MMCGYSSRYSPRKKAAPHVVIPTYNLVRRLKENNRNSTSLNCWASLSGMRVSDASISNVRNDNEVGSASEKVLLLIRDKSTVNQLTARGTNTRSLSREVPLRFPSKAAKVRQK